MRPRELSDEQRDKIRFLTGMGFKRWQKGSLDRLYIDARDLGLELDYQYGGIVSATLNGEEIDAADAANLRMAKTFISLPSGDAHSDDIRLMELAQTMFDSVWRR